MKSKIVPFVASALVIGALFVPSFANAKTTVIVATSVENNEQNYTIVTYNKFVELAQKYSDNAFDFQLFPSMQLGDEIATVRAAHGNSAHHSIGNQ